MKKTFLSVIALLILLIIGDRVGGALLSTAVLKSANRFAAIYNDAGAVDVLVLGNSRADLHFSPRMIQDQTGHQARNLGLGGISTVLSEALLLDHLDAYGAPKVLIIEPSNIITDPDRVGDMRLFARWSDRIAGLVRADTPEFYWAGKLSSLFNFNTDMFVRVLNDLRKKPAERLTKASIPAGLLTEINTTPPAKREKLRIRQANLQALDRILALARDRGINAHVVMTPYLPAFFDGHPDAARWQGEINRRTQAAGIPLHDLTGLVHDPALFRDRHHLNRAGAAVLVQALRQRGVLPTGAN